MNRKQANQILNLSILVTGVMSAYIIITKGGSWL